MSKESRIAAEIANRISAIALANGYTTDIGQRVFMGRRAIDKSSLPCAVIVNEETKGDMLQGSRCRVVGVFQIEGHSICDPDHPGDMGMKIIADLKRAIFSGDLSFGESVVSAEFVGSGTVPRENGLDVVSSAIKIELAYVENLAAP